MTEDILLNVEKQKSYSKVIQSYPKWTFLETHKKNFLTNMAKEVISFKKSLC